MNVKNALMYFIIRVEDAPFVGVGIQNILTTLIKRKG